jgi:hypothetical protein
LGREPKLIGDQQAEDVSPAGVGGDEVFDGGDAGIHGQNYELRIPNDQEKVRVGMNQYRFDSMVAGTTSLRTITDTSAPARCCRLFP